MLHETKEIDKPVTKDTDADTAAKSNVDADADTTADADTETRAAKNADADSDETNKPTYSKKKLSSKAIDAMIHRYHIEGGLLYFNSPTDGMVVCVPQGKAFDASLRDYSDLTDEAADHEKQHFTLRQTIIDELHLTPMSGHRGINARTS